MRPNAFTIEVPDEVLDDLRSQLARPEIAKLYPS
jgi:hypothetical protein